MEKQLKENFENNDYTVRNISKNRNNIKINISEQITTKEAQEIIDDTIDENYISLNVVTESDDYQDEPTTVINLKTF